MQVRNILIINTSPIIQRALKRVIELTHVTNTNFTDSEDGLSDFIKKKNIDILMLEESSRDDLYKLLWNKLRIMKKSILPVIVLGRDRIDPINIDIRDMVFEKEHDSHFYISPPYNLGDMLTAISEVRIIEKGLNEVIEKYSQWKGIVKEVLRHEIPNMLATGNRNRDSVLKLYETVKALLLEYDKNEELIDKVDSEMHRVEKFNINDKYGELSKNSRKISEVL